MAADRGMDQKEMAGLAAPAAVVGEMMIQLAGVVIRHQLPHRKATMVATAREAGPLKSAVAAVEQELPAERELPAARQEMAEQDFPAVLVALQPTMQEGAAALPQSREVVEMVVLAVAVVEMHRALQILVVAVVAVVFRVIRAV